MKTIEQLKQETQVPVIVVDEQGFITYINQCFQETYLWDTELIGKTLLDVIPTSFHDAHNLGFSRFSMTEKSNILDHPINAKVITKDGRAVWSEHWLIAEQLEGTWWFGATLRPLDL
nr:MAG: PAS domain S-box protein [Leptolyngbya sp. IPPAS B-1204]